MPEATVANIIWHVVAEQFPQGLYPVTYDLLTKFAPGIHLADYLNISVRSRYRARREPYTNLGGTTKIKNKIAYLPGAR